jgi:hypothetical protein
MTLQTHTHDPRHQFLDDLDVDHSAISRRKFLLTSGVGAAGLILFKPSVAYASPIFGAVAKFALSVGASVEVFLSGDRENKQADDSTRVQ